MGVFIRSKRWLDWHCYNVIFLFVGLSLLYVRSFPCVLWRILKKLLNVLCVICACCTRDFILHDEHKSVDCNICHVNDQWTDIGETCTDCHKADDSHQNRFGSQCKECHSEKGWKKPTFDHNADTKFKLRCAIATLSDGKFELLIRGLRLSFFLRYLYFPILCFAPQFIFFNNF